MIHRPWLLLALLCLMLSPFPALAQGVLEQMQQNDLTEPPGAPAMQQAPATQPDETKVSRAERSRQSALAIQRAVKFLLSQQNSDGSWGSENQGWRPGETALVILAMLYSGESHQSPALAKAIKYLKYAPSTGNQWATYSVGLRSAVYSSLPEVMRKDELRSDMRWLQDAVIDNGNRRGMYSYGTGANFRNAGDYSNSQYGVLGVWYAQQVGLEVPKAYWKKVEDGWLAGQNADGGWPYTPGVGDSYASMTAAAAATLYITSDYLHLADAQDLNKRTINRPLDAAMKWLGDNFAVDYNPGKVQQGVGRRRGGPDRDVQNLMGDLGRPPPIHVDYMLFGYERVGEASGLTRFGTHPWYEEGADFLIRTQAYDGSWHDVNGSEVATCYGLLFLSRGRAPVVAQKLQFEDRWNNRPRDVAAFTQFMRRATERHVNWQVVSIDADAEQFREAPMLYIASDRALKLKSEQITKLKAYIDQGGLLVCVNEGKTDDFTRSVVGLGEQLYPTYKFRDLPANHLAYTANFAGNRDAERIRGLSNGVRDLIVLYPIGDMSWKWHSTGGGFLPKNTPYATLANLWLYVTDRANPRYKGEDPWVDRNEGVEISRRTRVARIVYDGNWDPEPGGWERLTNLMHNFDQIDVSVAPSIDPQTEVLAHITGTNSLAFSAELRASVKNYVAHGGLLLMDAAGGSSEAAGSFEPMLHELFPTVVVGSLPLDHPIYHAQTMGGQEITDVKYRRSQNLSPVRIPRLRGATVNGKLIAIISAEDMSGGLVGYSTTGLTGYTTNSATDLMRNIILWRSSALQ